MRDLTKVEVFYLNELTEREVVEAIKRPTSREDFAPYGKPSDHYHFVFEEGLPERIAHDVMFSQNIKGGVLPVVQIVCENLYNSTKKKSASNSIFVIKLEDYAALPKVEVQLEEYLRQKLVEFAGQKIQGTFMDDEVDRWKDVLSGLSISQIDGTVVTQLKSKDDLQSLARKFGCRLPFDATMGFLSDPNVRILRGEEVINSVTNKPVYAYSLGHDAIGLVMERWKTIKQERNRRMAQLRPLYIGLGASFIALILVFRRFRFDAITLVALFYGLSFMLIGAFPGFLSRNPLFRRLLFRWLTPGRLHKVTGQRV